MRKGLRALLALVLALLPGMARSEAVFTREVDHVISMEALEGALLLSGSYADGEADRPSVKFLDFAGRRLYSRGDRAHDGGYADAALFDGGGCAVLRYGDEGYCVDFFRDRESVWNREVSERGALNLNDPVEIVGIKETQSSVATGIEMFRKTMDYCEAGDNVGILLRGIKREDIERGQVICKPGSVTPHKKFTGEVYVLTKEEGGRHTPFFNNYRPQFYFRTTDVTGSLNLPEGVEMAMPGDHVTVECELIHPIAMEEGLRFAIREGGHTVGDGRVATIED